VAVLSMKTFLVFIVILECSPSCRRKNKRIDDENISTST